MKNYVEIAAQYARDVLDGTIPACKWTKLAVKRQLDDLQREQGPDWPWVFDHDRACRPCAFIELLPHIKGKWAREGRLIELEPWQCWILTTVFGWVHHETRLRRFLEAYEEEARKNGKSAKGSGLLLYMLTADNEHGAECYTAATTRDQARITFDDAKAMGERSPGLRTQLGLAIMQHSLVVAHTSSKAAPLAAEGSTLDGLNVHFALLDELHAHKTRAVYDVIDTGRGAREQSLLWTITTAGSDRSGICYERRTHVTKILERSVIDERVFGVIYTIDDGDDYFDPAVWIKANPNLGKSVQIDEMQSQASKARAMPSALNNFLTKRLNVWVNADSVWMEMSAWDRCANPQLTLDQVSHLPCVMGLDLASKVDIAAKVRVFHDAAQRRYYVIGQYYLPERAVEQGSNSQYSGWQRSGWLTVTPGDVTDFDQIELDLGEDMSRLQVNEIAFDPWQATQLASHMIERGAPMVELRQTVQNMSEPMKQLEALVLKGNLEHDGNPVLTWMISNVVAHLDAKDNIYPRKERAENKIDGAVALIMALARMIQPDDSSSFVIGPGYEMTFV